MNGSKIRLGSKMRSIASKQTSIENQQPLPALTQNLSAQQNETAGYNNWNNNNK